MLVVVPPPVLQHLAGVRQRAEQRLVEQLVAQAAIWPAAGSVDTEIGCSQGLEDGDATQEVFARVQD